MQRGGVSTAAIQGRPVSRWAGPAVAPLGRRRRRARGGTPACVRLHMRMAIATRRCGRGLGSCSGREI
eukprot:966219-Alexandrium_andersonii.AAC.1